MSTESSASTAHPDPALWRLSDEQAEALDLWIDHKYGINGPEDPRPYQVIDGLIALGIVRDPREHGPEKCVPVEPLVSWLRAVEAGKGDPNESGAQIANHALRMIGAAPASPQLTEPSEAAIEAACAEVYGAWHAFPEEAKPTGRKVMRRALLAARAAQNGDAERG